MSFGLGLDVAPPYYAEPVYPGYGAEIVPDVVIGGGGFYGGGGYYGGWRHGERGFAGGRGHFGGGFGGRGRSGGGGRGRGH